MEGKNKIEDFEDPDFFTNIKNAIEKEFTNIRKILNSMSQLRVETALLEADLIMTINSSTWEDISEFIGLSSGMMDAGLEDAMPRYQENVKKTENE